MSKYGDGSLLSRIRGWLGYSPSRAMSESMAEGVRLMAERIQSIGSVSQVNRQTERIAQLEAVLTALAGDAAGYDGAYCTYCDEYCLNPHRPHCPVSVARKLLAHE